ncbi:MAG TPA: ATP-binding protein [Solirubrobacterales bacterium]|nr:ATP-binding protein [Solirubrobacterales bacterium]
MLSTIRSFTLDGISARPVRVEVDVHRGLPAFNVVGLPDAAVREARERVRAALANCGFDFPLQRIVANLAPASLRKAGPGLDLAIAVALLVASGQLEWDRLARVAMVGELALDGAVRGVPGVLAIAEAAREQGAEAIVVPAENGPEASLVSGIDVLPLESLGQVVQLASGEWTPARPQPLSLPLDPRPGAPDLADLRGQPHLRYAMEVAAAGGHSLLMVGPPGAGKSLAASRLPSILPPLAGGEALEVARIASACGRLNPGFGGGRPFRAPHHTVSPAGLVGGANPPAPGQATLAHRGVLFLDELCEFRRDTLEALRGPLESGQVTISRAGLQPAAALPPDARRRLQSLPLRARRGRPGVHLSAARGAPLPVEAERRARRSAGHPGRDPPAERGGDRRPAGRVLGGRARAGARRARAPGSAARRRSLQRRDDARRGARAGAVRGRRGVARRDLPAPAAQRPRPRPRAAPGAHRRRPRGGRRRRPRPDRPSAATEEERP